jgi:hypothetical protein
MGAKPARLIRVVLDTNTLVSALLFPDVASGLVPLWQKGSLALLVSKEILEEYWRVLAYPKFRLTEGEVRALIDEEVLPFAEPIRVTTRLPALADPDHTKFLECAVAGRARYLVTGDSGLLELHPYRRISTLRVGDFLTKVRLGPGDRHTP